MKPTPVSHPDPTPVPSNHRLVEFSRFALDALAVPVEDLGERRFRVIQNEQTPAWAREFSDHTYGNEAVGDEADVAITLDSPFVRTILHQAEAAGVAINAAPRDQVTAVSDLGPTLFEKFSVEGGHAYLAGCQLSDRPFLRLTVRCNEQDNEIDHLLIQSDGTVADPVLLESLRFPMVKPFRPRDTPLNRDVQENWIHIGCEAGKIEAESLVAATIVWCKHAEGKLAFVIGDQTVEWPFDGWAQRLVDGLDEIPPYYCPIMKTASYHLAATDDGVITTNESVETCDETNKRCLTTELATCEATGKRVNRTLLQTCPVTQEQVSSRQMVPCTDCGEQVSPNAIRKGHCNACRGMSKVTKSEARLARVLGEYPSLDRWRNWKLAETEQVYILVASGLLRQLQLVVDKSSLEVRRVAIANRFATTWTELSGLQREELLK